MLRLSSKLCSCYRCSLGTLLESVDSLMPADPGNTWQQVKAAIGYIHVIDDALMGRPIALAGAPHDNVLNGSELDATNRALQAVWSAINSSSTNMSDSSWFKFSCTLYSAFEVFFELF